ncbi:hypothetical protein FACS1894219_08460 [Clostridia bacterium]|nr:hypothetical protein FACS1894219_08460 [Clostridia bacterium]
MSLEKRSPLPNGAKIAFAYGAYSPERETQVTAYSWSAIPDCILYSVWTSAFSDDAGLYNQLVKPDIINKILSIKAPYVDENSRES